MRSTSNFLPSLSQTTPRHVTTSANYGASNLSPNMCNNRGDDSSSANHSSIKLENRIFYMEKAVARLIHAFESTGGRMHKMESAQNDMNTNIGAISKALKEARESNKDFISKQHMVTEQMANSLHKQAATQSQQASALNKEISDIRDSMQQLASNLQKNFNECIKAAIQQCSDLNVQNANSIQSLRKISDQKMSHLQSLLVDSQKRAQSQNASILDIINSNQKNQSEFQNSFKVFFEKFRDSMHQNLSALQESSQEQISYLDNVLRAEVKSRMKQTQSIITDTDAKLFAIEEQLQQFKRDSKRSWDFVTKNLDAVKESQQHQTTANQPMHKIITNLTSQFDDLGSQHLTDVKSIMMLNQDTSEKQFNQIKSLQIQMQQLWTKVSQQQRQNGDVLTSPNAQFHSPSHNTSDNQYLVRPSSYKSDMSSNAAFNAIKHHLNNMPGKPLPTEQPMDNDFNNYIEEVTPRPSAIMESASQFVEASPRPMRKEREPILEVLTGTVADNKEDAPNEQQPKSTLTVAVEKTPVSFTPNDDLEIKSEDTRQSAVFENQQQNEMEDNYDDDEYVEDEVVAESKVKLNDEDKPDDVETEVMAERPPVNDHKVTDEESEKMEIDGGGIDEMSEEKDAIEQKQGDAMDAENGTVNETEEAITGTDHQTVPNGADANAQEDHEEEYEDEEYEEEAAEDDANAEEQEIDLSDTDDHQTGDLEEQEKALAMLEQEQSELSEPKASDQNDDDYDSDDF